MFGTSGSPPKEEDTISEPQSPADSQKAGGDGTGDTGNGADKKTNSSHSPPGRKPAEDGGPSGEKKRRSSGVSKARDIFSNAKQSLHLHGSPANNGGQQEKTPQTPIQKLSKTDPALSVPQGSQNNSAGESVPGPRSTFRVGVTEDKNKKCRRTMEDTHAYLYNFLSTPAPSLGTESANKSRNSVVDALQTNLDSSLQHVVETDNGYFAIFDGHAGTFAADWCGKKLHLLLEETIRKNPNTPIPELLDSTFTNVDQQLEKLPLKNSGCTAVIAVLRWEDRIPNSQSATGSSAIAPAVAVAAAKAASEPSAHTLANAHTNVNASTDGQNNADTGADTAKAAQQEHRPSAPQEARLRETASRQRVLYTANVGDARIVLCRNGKALRLSYDHKGSDENEGKRIANAGGLILNNRVNGVLAVTRALGDSYMKDLVTGHPYTTETVIQPDIDEFLILACDGVCIHQNTTQEITLIVNTALGRLQRPRSRRPRPPNHRPPSRIQTARRPRPLALLHRQPLLHDRPV